MLNSTELPPSLAETSAGGPDARNPDTTTAKGLFPPVGPPRAAPVTDSRPLQGTRGGYFMQTERTSSRSVSPRRILRMPSCLRRTMPFRIATSRILEERAFP